MRDREIFSDINSYAMYVDIRALPKEKIARNLENRGGD